MAALLVVSDGSMTAYAAAKRGVANPGYSGGGKERAMEEKAKGGAAQLKEEGKQVLDGAKELKDQIKETITK